MGPTEMPGTETVSRKPESRWKKAILRRVPLVALAILVASCAPRSQPGKFPYDASVVDRQGTLTSFASLRGHPVVLVAYVASMPDCRKRIERFVALSDRFRSTEIRFLAVDIGSLESDKFPDLLPADRGKVLFLNDRNDEVRRALKIDITPTTFLVSADGKIRDRIEAVYTWDHPDFRRRVEPLDRNR
jgi:peroxiredoxin